MYKKSFFNAKGMTLVEVMVTSGIAILVVMAMGNAMIGLYKQQGGITKTDQANELSSSIGRFLKNRAFCEEALKDQDFASTADKDVIVIRNAIISKREEAATPHTAHLDDVAAGMIIDDVVKIQNVTISNSGHPDEPTIFNNRNHNIRMAEIEVQLAILEPGKDGLHEKPLRPRKYVLPLVVDSSDKIASCNTELQLVEACRATGTRFNEATGQCVPDDNCYMRGTYTLSTCSPASSGCVPSVLNTFTNSTSCPADATASQTGDFTNTFQEHCGKKCSRTITNRIQYYICLRCG